MTDLISRQWLLDKMKQNRKKFCKNRIEFKALSTIDKTRVDEIDNCISEIINAPTEQKTGKWQKYEGRFDYNWECSECGCSAWEKTDYCAHCGARMESKNENTSDTYDRE